LSAVAANDPAATTAAWLARIPVSERVAAQAATDWRLFAWAAGWLIAIGACVVISRAGLPRRIRQRLETGQPRPWLVNATIAGAMALILSVTNAVVSGVGDWQADRLLHGAGASGVAAHLALAASGIALTTLAAAVLSPPAYWLMLRWPRTWPAILGPALAALILGLGWLPYALSAGSDLGPAPPGPVRDSLQRLLVASGLPTRDVFVSYGPAFDGDVTGAFGHAKVTVGPGLLAGPPAEARAYVGHLMGHYAHSDILIVCLVLAAVIFFGLIAVQQLTSPLARRIGAGLSPVTPDPEAMPAATIIALLSVLVAGLAASAYLRWANVRADEYSLNYAREPDGLAAVIEREWDHQAVDPSPPETAVFYTHPPLVARVRHAMDWKAAHGG
jgi:STE24 endopeptidase